MRVRVRVFNSTRSKTIVLLCVVARRINTFFELCVIMFGGLFFSLHLYIVAVILQFIDHVPCCAKTVYYIFPGNENKRAKGMQAKVHLKLWMSKCETAVLQFGYYQ